MGGKYQNGSTKKWIDSAQDRDYCTALVNASLDLRGFIIHGVNVLITAAHLVLFNAYRRG